ncbi:MAG: PorV/PorQ family protein [Calditrichaeota bacterium]|nr:PorV/PorQ family protein [Calditrichota bacterium]RQW08136.1 MAG: PorV/PorQ family protein [Calditrichota bacterium]
MNRFRFWYFMVFVVLILANSESEASGNNAFNFLQMNIGSRAQGMGKAFTAVSGDLNGLYYNPASVGFALHPSLMFYHAQLYEDIAIENFSAMLPDVRNFTFSMGLSYLHLPEIDEYEINGGSPVHLGTFQVYDFVSQVGVSYLMNRRVSMGMQMKYLQERIDEVTASGVAFDIGVLARLPIDYLSIGASVQNMGPNVKFDQTKEKLPLTYRLGLAYQLPAYMVTFAFDAVKTIDEDWQFYPGLEMEFLKSLAIRTGYQYNPDVGGGYNVGAGLKFLDNYRLNYVFSSAGILGSTHRAEICINLRSGKDKKSYDYVKAFPASNKATSMNVNRNISYFLPVPGSLTYRKLSNELILSWEKSALSDAQYHVWVEIPGKTGIVKITEKPLSENIYTFKPTVDKIDLVFYVSLYKDGKESEFSEPLKVKYRK